VIVVPSEYGISAVGQSAPAETLGKEGLDLWELSWMASGRPPALRLHDAVLAPWRDCSPVKDLINIANEPSWERQSLQEAIDAVLVYEPDGDEPPHPPEWLRKLLKAVRDGRFEDHPAGGAVLFARKSDHDRDAELDLFADDDDLLSASNRAISLAD